ncbi:hypothetical protein MG293_018842 [Ovis ammon polii]|uniref:Tripartite motif-containing protein 40 n=1 Tax=Ovis ammon polii TaxID=230172 RepID=A0AAD4TRD6_OVIAM|nr:hypothetical protein MG293_018842 [Ovis ammon polii]
MGSLRQDRREEGVCPICQECLKEAVRTDCGHLFCRACLAQHLEKASASGVRSCPLCRKPCSEGVLGAGYTCDSHQKKVCWFCEESRSLLCMECLVTPEYKSHNELTIENAISHYKERLNRRVRKLRKDICELQRLKTQEEERLQEMKDASDLLNRSAPEAIYPNLEKRINESLVQPSSAALTCSSLGHLISDSPHPPGSPSPNLCSLPLGLPGGPSDLPSPEHDLHSSSPEL